jgi:hypothetical protein
MAAAPALVYSPAFQAGAAVPARTPGQSHPISCSIATGFDASVAQLSQFGGIALTRHNGIQDGQPRDARDVADHMMDLQIHLGEGFVHVLDVLGRHLHQLLSMAHNGAHGAHWVLRPESGAQQAHRMQKLNPLALMPVGAASRYVLHVARVDHAGLQTAAIQDFK